MTKLSQMGALSEFFNDLPQAWKAVTALVGALGIGAAGALGAVGFVGLPERVEANTVAIRANTIAIDRLAHGDSTIICLLTLPDTLDHIEARRRCP